MQDKLLPCPFCGSENIEIMRVHGRHEVACSDCCGNTATYPTSEEAIAVWNRRDGKGQNHNILYRKP